MRKGERERERERERQGGGVERGRENNRAIVRHRESVREALYVCTFRDGDGGPLAAQ